MTTSADPTVAIITLFITRKGQDTLMASDRRLIPATDITACAPRLSHTITADITGIS